MSELVEAKVKVPKKILDFYKAMFEICRYKEQMSFEEFLGEQILIAVDGHKNNALAEFSQRIMEIFGLDN